MICWGTESRIWVRWPKGGRNQDRYSWHWACDILCSNNNMPGSSNCAIFFHLLNQPSLAYIVHRVGRSIGITYIGYIGITQLLQPVLPLDQTLLDVVTPSVGVRRRDQQQASIEELNRHVRCVCFTPPKRIPTFQDFLFATRNKCIVSSNKCLTSS